MNEVISAVALVLDEHKIISPLESDSRIKITYVNPKDFSFDKFTSDIILTVSDWRSEIAEVLIEAQKKGIPTLMFQDGTLDWIIQYEGDRYGGSGGPTHFHPILTDKIAVMGHQSARILSAWNDPTKVEITGYPILQQIIQDQIESTGTSPRDSEKIHILITSTRQGWFSDEQKDAFVRALLDLKQFFENNPRYQPVWRLSRNLSDLIGVSNTLKQKESAELRDLIKESDLVISAQSTVVVEAMLHEKPVAILDYLNKPQFYPTAWFITHKDQIEATISSMVAKEVNRMLYQDTILKDVLYFNQNSITRSVDLIMRMVQHSKTAPGQPMPENLLGFNEPFTLPQTAVSVSEVYPKMKKFEGQNPDELILLIARYKRENEMLRESLKSQSLFKLVTKTVKKLKRK
jgi:hypothetical protein